MFLVVVLDGLPHAGNAGPEQNKQKNLQKTGIP
jgi:hypothetical protein